MMRSSELCNIRLLEWKLFAILSRYEQIKKAGSSIRFFIIGQILRFVVWLMAINNRVRSLLPERPARLIRQRLHKI